MTYTQEQMRAYMAARRARIREDLIALLGGECTKCGATEDLQFDHVDPQTKTFTIASGLDRPRAELLTEIAKCQLLCAVHHHEKTFAESAGVARAGASQVRGESSGRAKLTEVQVRVIRASADSVTALAAQFGLAHSTVSAIRNRRTWAHVL